MTSEVSGSSQTSESGWRLFWEEAEFFDWVFLLVPGTVQFTPHNIKTNAIKAIRQSHSLTHPVKFLSPAMFPLNFKKKNTVSSSATPATDLG